LRQGSALERDLEGLLDAGQGLRDQTFGLGLLGELREVWAVVPGTDPTTVIVAPVMPIPGWNVMPTVVSRLIVLLRFDQVFPPATPWPRLA
jgi:hypothetical protein